MDRLNCLYLLWARNLKAQQTLTQSRKIERPLIETWFLIEIHTTNKTIK